MHFGHCIQILQWIQCSKYPIPRHGVRSHSMMITQLISKCGNKEELHRILNVIPEEHKDPILVSSMLKALMVFKQYRDALSLYLRHDALADNVCHLMAIKLCRMNNDYDRGKEIHSKIRWNSSSTDYDVPLRTALMSFYVDFGEIESALDLFEDIMVYRPNAISVNAMMTILVENGWSHLALSLYLDHFHHVDDVSHLKALRACIEIGDFELGQSVHFGINGVEQRSISLKHSLIDFYGHFGDPVMARNIFESIDVEDRDSFSIGSMMKALIHCGLYDDALRVYQSHRCLTNDVCHTLAMSACKSSGDLERGTAIHGEIEGERKSKMSLELQNALISFYGHFGDISTAELLFNSIPNYVKDAVTINTMMSIYVDNERNAKALRLYDGFWNVVNDRSHFCAIRAARNLRDLQRGKRIHSKLGRNQDVHLNAALIDFYASFGDIVGAENVFFAVDCFKRSEVVLNAIMSVLIEADPNIINGPQRALDIYHSNPPFLRDEVTYSLVIRSYGLLDDIESARNVFDGVIAAHSDAASTENGNGSNARVGVYNAMMEALWHCQHYQQCIECFQSLDANSNGLSPDISSHVIAFKACTNGSIYHFGSKLHRRLQCDDVLKWMLDEVSVRVSLISLYGKCGDLDLCRSIMGALTENTDISICNSMINALGRNGEMQRAQELYDSMKGEMGINPNEKTFLLMMNGYSHCGDVESVMNLWNEQIIGDDEMKYNERILTTMVDCMARKGRFKEAMEFIQKLSADDDSKGKVQCEALWIALLSGCRKHGDLETAERVHEALSDDKWFQLKEADRVSVLLLMANIYGAHSEFEKMKDIEALIESEKLEKCKRIPFQRDSKRKRGGVTDHYLSRCGDGRI